MSDIDWTVLGPGMVGIPVLGALLWYLAPRLLRWWHLRRVYQPGVAGFHPPHPVRMRPEAPEDEPSSPLELLPPTVGVGSFAEGAPSPNTTPVHVLNTHRRSVTIQTPDA